MKKRKILEKILAGSKNIRFEEFLALIEAFGFILDRVKGSHYLFSHPDVPHTFPFQGMKGKAKQLLQLVAMYNLKLDEDAQDEEPEQNE